MVFLVHPLFHDLPSSFSFPLLISSSLFSVAPFSFLIGPGLVSNVLSCMRRWGVLCLDPPFRLPISGPPHMCSLLSLLLHGIAVYTFRHGKASTLASHHRHYHHHHYHHHHHRRLVSIYVPCGDLGPRLLRQASLGLDMLFVVIYFPYITKGTFSLFSS